MVISSEALWVSLFVFLLCASVFGIASVTERKPLWRFGVGFGLVIAFTFPLAEIAMPIISSWSFPLILFVGVPSVIVSLFFFIILAFLLGMVFYQGFSATYHKGE